MLLKRRAMMFQHGSAPQRRLPYDYQELAYIESTGTQYIDPDFSIVAETDDLSIEASWTSTGTIQIVGGVKTSSPITRYAIFQQMADNCIGFDIRDSSGTNRISSSIQGYGSKHFIVISKNKLTIDGSYIGQSAGVNPLSQKIIYFGVCNTTTSPFTNSLYPSRIYYSRIERNGSLIRNLIPAMRYSDKVAGLYDTVNDVFYTNQGTGEFKMGPWVPYRLPDDFQEVEYIGNTSRSYINTGYKPNINSEVELTYNYYSYGTQSGNQLLGAQNATNGAQALIMGSTLQSASVGVGKWVRLHQTSITSNYNFDGGCANDYNKHTWYLDKSKIIYDNVTYSWETTPSLTSQINYPLYLFARNNVGNVYPVSGNFALINVYELKISESGVPKSDLIPCYRISDGAIGMYDTVSNTFKTNSGTGTFTKGSNLPKRLPDEYQEVSYIGGTGTQYIMTNVVPNNATGIRQIWAPDELVDSFYCGARSTTGDTRYVLGRGTSGKVYWGWNTTAVVPAADRPYIDDGTYIDMSMNLYNNRKCSADGVTYASTLPELASQTKTIAFLAATLSADIMIRKCKVKLCQITQGTSLVFYGVPCYRKSDNAIGLYDLCSSSMILNAGSGTFTKGADV